MDQRIHAWIAIRAVALLEDYQSAQPVRSQHGSSGWAPNSGGRSPTASLGYGGAPLDLFGSCHLLRAHPPVKVFFRHESELQGGLAKR